MSFFIQNLVVFYSKLSTWNKKRHLSQPSERRDNFQLPDSPELLFGWSEMLRGSASDVGWLSWLPNPGVVFYSSKSNKKRQRAVTIKRNNTAKKADAKFQLYQRPFDFCRNPGNRSMEFRVEIGRIKPVIFLILNKKRHQALVGG